MRRPATYDPTPVENRRPWPTQVRCRLGRSPEGGVFASSLHPQVRVRSSRLGERAPSDANEQVDCPPRRQPEARPSRGRRVGPAVAPRTDAPSLFYRSVLPVRLRQGRNRRKGPDNWRTEAQVSAHDGSWRTTANAFARQRSAVRVRSPPLDLPVREPGLWYSPTAPRWAVGDPPVADRSHDHPLSSRAPLDRVQDPVVAHAA